jgi:hypothetical protein
VTARRPPATPIQTPASRPHTGWRVKAPGRSGVLGEGAGRGARTAARPAPGQQTAAAAPPGHRPANPPSGSRSFIYAERRDGGHPRAHKAAPRVRPRRAARCHHDQGNGKSASQGKPARAPAAAPASPAAPAAARARTERRAPAAPPPVPIGDQGPGDPRPERVQGGAKRRRRRRREAPLTRAGRPRTIERRPGGTTTAPPAPGKGATRPKARTGETKAQASQAASVIEVRPESGTTVQKIGHNTHTGTVQSPYSDSTHIRKASVTCLYDRCSAAVRASRNHLTNVVLAAQPVVVHPGNGRHAGVHFTPGLTLGRRRHSPEPIKVGERRSYVVERLGVGERTADDRPVGG